MSPAPIYKARGGWMPQDPDVLDRWPSKTDAKSELFVEIIQQFKNFIEGDPTPIFALFRQMFNHVPTMDPYDKDTWKQPS
ncbi:hypothetical protein C0991_012289, partial [Blastosporella zonata]